MKYAKAPVAGEMVRDLTATGKCEIRNKVIYWELTCRHGCRKFLPVSLVGRGRSRCCWFTGIKVPEVRTYGVFTTTGGVEMRPHKSDKPSRGGETYWEVICSLCCEKSFRLASVVKGSRFKSCGCLQRERTRKLGKSSIALPGNSSMRCLLVTYKTSARKRGHSWFLTIDEFVKITKGHCYYCGVEPAQVCHPTSHGKLTINGPYLYNGIDRVDSSIGYEAANCVPCCNMCNVMKMAHSHDAFISHINKIYKHSIAA